MSFPSCSASSTAGEAFRRPHYWPEDSLHLFNRLGSFYLQLANKSLLHRLRSLCSGARGYEKYLPEYPTVLCAPLDLLYAFRRAACTLDDELLQDLLFSYGWREANWGAWLAALAPSKSYTAHLQRRRSTLPHGTVIVDLALASCGLHDAPDELHEHGALLSEVRHLLSRIPRVVSPLRLAPTLEEEELMKAEMGTVRTAYHRGGGAEAKAVMRQKRYLSLYMARGHLEWARLRGTPT